MKYFFFLLIFLTSFQATSQVLGEKDVKRLSAFDINAGNFDLNDVKVTNDFRGILETEKKRKSNKISQLILTTLSAVSLGVGLAVITNPPKPFWDENPYRGLVGSTFLGLGAIKGGIGIPLLFISKKQKSKRDRIIENYEENFLIIINL